MSQTFESTNAAKTLEVQRFARVDAVSLSIDGEDDAMSINIKRADAPALALAILEASGIEPTYAHPDSLGDVPELIDMATWCLYRAGKVAQDAESAALDKRRDELARSFISVPYINADMPLQRAIAHIIELEARS